MQNKPLVTIITVTYNLIEAGRKKYFRQCLESVHNQTYENIEHIIIDGASTDGTLNLIEEYKKRGWIMYISEKDNGIYDAMNKGIKRANGKYIAFLNSDDYYSSKEVVNLSIDQLERKSADFSYGHCNQLFENEKKIWKGRIEIFLYSMPFSHQTMFVNTNIIKKYYFNSTYKVAADYDLIIKLILNDYKSVAVNKKIVSCRMIGDSQILLHECIIETEKIYKENFEIFHNFEDYKKISNLRYKCKITNKFINDVEQYFNNNLNNIDVQKIVENLNNKKISCLYNSNHILGYLLKIKKKFFPNKWF